jgi:hypothetical protein
MIISDPRNTGEGWEIMKYLGRTNPFSPERM